MSDHIPSAGDEVFLVRLDSERYPYCDRFVVDHVARTWWHIRHADGSLSAHNGGGIGAWRGRMTNSLGRQLKPTESEAWADAAERAAMSLYRAAKDSGGSSIAFFNALVLVRRVAFQAFNGEQWSCAIAKG